MTGNMLIIAGIAGLVGFLIWDFARKALNNDPPIEKSQQMNQVSDAKGKTRIWVAR